MTEVRTRILVSAVLVPLAFFALYYGGIPLILALGTVASLGSLEYITMMRKAKIGIPYLWCVISVGVYLVMVLSPQNDLLLLWLIMFIAFTEALFSWDQDKTVPRMFASLFGIIYTAVFPAMITRIGLANPEENCDDLDSGHKCLLCWCEVW